MTVELVRNVLGWTALLNYLVLLWWVLFIFYFHDWVFNIHSKWFKLSLEQFDIIHYSGIAVYKIAIFLFALTPYLALLIIL